MTPAVTARARLELIAAGGFDDLLPTDPSAFRESERLTLAAPGVIAARVVFAARRRHFLPGSDPVLVDLPASETSAIAISATRIAVGAMREMHEKMAQAKTPEERQALMADHMNAMQGGMQMMKGMGGMR